MASNTIGTYLPAHISSYATGQQNYHYIKKEALVSKEEKVLLYEKNKKVLQLVEADLFNTIALIKKAKKPEEKSKLEKRYEYLATLYSKANPYTDNIDYQLD